MYFAKGKKNNFLTGRPQAMHYKKYALVLAQVFQGIHKSTYMPLEDNI